MVLSRQQRGVLHPKIAVVGNLPDGVLVGAQGLVHAPLLLEEARVIAVIGDLVALQLDRPAEVTNGVLAVGPGHRPGQFRPGNRSQVGRLVVVGDQGQEGVGLLDEEHPVPLLPGVPHQLGEQALGVQVLGVLDDGRSQRREGLAERARTSACRSSPRRGG